MYGTNYQLMLRVQPQFTCSNPDMMITYAQELLMLSKSSLAEVLFNSSLFTVCCLQFVVYSLLFTVYCTIYSIKEQVFLPF